MECSAQDSGVGATGSHCPVCRTHNLGDLTQTMALNRLRSPMVRISAAICTSRPSGARTACASSHGRSGPATQRPPRDSRGKDPPPIWWDAQSSRCLTRKCGGVVSVECDGARERKTDQCPSFPPAGRRSTRLIAMLAASAANPDAFANCHAHSAAYIATPCDEASWEASRPRSRRATAR